MGFIDKLKTTATGAQKEVVGAVLDKAVEAANEEIDGLPNPEDEKALMKDGVLLLKNRVQQGIDEKLG